MSGRMLAVLVLMGLVVTLGMGCDATVPKKDYDALGANYKQAQDDNKALRSELTTTKSEKENAEAELAKLKANMGPLPGGVSTHTIGGQPAIRMEASLLYASGKADLTPAGKSALEQVASILKKQYGNCEIRVEGHTDTDPISRTKDKYDTNWDLGSKRSNEVVVYLTEKCGVDPKKVYSASYSMYRPIGSNKVANRRVEIVILPPMTPGSSYSPSGMIGEPEEK